MDATDTESLLAEAPEPAPTLPAHAAWRPRVRKSMPDSVRSLPPPNLRFMIAAGSLTVCEEK